LYDTVTFPDLKSSMTLGEEYRSLHASRGMSSKFQSDGWCCSSKIVLLGLLNDPIVFLKAGFYVGIV
jgi:hypothetical protein